MLRCVPGIHPREYIPGSNAYQARQYTHLFGEQRIHLSTQGCEYYSKHNE